MLYTTDLNIQTSLITTNDFNESPPHSHLLPNRQQTLTIIPCSSKLHGDTKSVLESRSVGSSDGSTSSEVNLRSNLLDKTGRGDSVAANLCLDGSDRSQATVSTSDSRDVACLGGGVSSAGGKGEVLVNFVHDTDIELSELIGRSNRGVHGSGGVASSNIVGRESSLIAGEVVGEVSSEVDSGRDTDAGRCGEFGHVEHIERSGGGHFSSGVLQSEVSALVRLECHFAARARNERSFQNIASVSFEVNLVEAEAGVGKLTSNFGGKSSSGGALSFNRNGDGASRETLGL